MRLTGFPLVLQLLAFELVPQLLNKLPTTAANHTLLHFEGVDIPTQGSLWENDVLLAEYDPSVSTNLCDSLHSKLNLSTCKVYVS